MGVEKLSEVTFVIVVVRKCISKMYSTVSCSNIPYTQTVTYTLYIYIINSSDRHIVCTQKKGRKKISVCAFKQALTYCRHAMFKTCTQTFDTSCGGGTHGRLGCYFHTCAAAQSRKSSCWQCLIPLRCRTSVSVREIPLGPSRSSSA